MIRTEVSPGFQIARSPIAATCEVNGMASVEALIVPISAKHVSLHSYMSKKTHDMLSQ